MKQKPLSSEQLIARMLANNEDADRTIDSAYLDGNATTVAFRSEEGSCREVQGDEHMAFSRDSSTTEGGEGAGGPVPTCDDKTGCDDYDGLHGAGRICQDSKCCCRGDFHPAVEELEIRQHDLESIQDDLTDPTSGLPAIGSRRYYEHRENRYLEKERNKSKSETTKDDSDDGGSSSSSNGLEEDSQLTCFGKRRRRRREDAVCAWVCCGVFLLILIVILVAVLSGVKSGRVGSGQQPVIPNGGGGGGAGNPGADRPNDNKPPKKPQMDDLRRSWRRAR